MLCECHMQLLALLGALFQADVMPTQHSVLHDLFDMYIVHVVNINYQDHELQMIS